ncbi:50S ribosomal protein L18 [archaeon]|jgi:large subunit ribosomal protein L18|nr:50S ribosomal protein L18 [archaeon]MBT4397020.1 50S ribosomal protein L18 [archaeon]MBT4441011.1 50S ribosomal protein L18 [archaeon]
MRRQKFVKYRRKREGKTNYSKRLRMLKGEKVRLVARKTLRYITAQLIKFDPNGDKVLVAANTQELKKYGWKGYGRNVPAGYLLGMLIAKKAKKAKVGEALFDIGLNNTTSTVLFAILKGAVDGGLNLPHSEELYPKEDRVIGKHISEEMVKNFNDTKSKIEKGET